MRHLAKTGLACLACLLVAITGCRGAEPSPAEPSPNVPAEADAAPADPDPAPTDPASAAKAETPPADGPRVALDAEFHRTRVGPGGGFWVLGTVTNPGEAAVVDVRPRVRLLDEEGTMLRSVHGRARAIAAGEEAAIVVLVEAPVEHEALELDATGIESEAGPAPIPAVELEHGEPQRANLGGYFVLGQISNTAEVAEGTALRLEVRAYDGDDRLLGVDWFASTAPPPGQSAPFDLGGLRYEQPPKRFALDLVGPAPEFEADETP